MGGAPMPIPPTALMPLLADAPFWTSLRQVSVARSVLAGDHAASGRSLSVQQQFRERISGAPAVKPVEVREE